MITRNIDALTTGYFRQQRLRIEVNRRRIAINKAPLSTGRLIPNPEEIPIGTGRRINASILFLDICGFSKIPANTQNEQESILRVFSLFFSEMIRIVEDHGGVVEKNTGDGLMCYFTKRTFVQDSAQKRAVSAAMTMVHTNEKLINPILVASGIAPIKFRIGIDHGDVSIARLGAAKRFNHIVAIGSAANRACKMLGFADDDEILLGDNVLSEIPANWVYHATPKTDETGWTFVETGAPYKFWSFGGRWVTPDP